MYSTRRVNKNVVEGGAYITIGDPYNSNKAPAPDRWRGKRLTCQAYPPPHFTPFTYTSEPVPEAEPSKPQQASEKAAAGFGFGSRAAHSRDEFALTKRTEAYRQTLRKEIQLNIKRGGSGGGGGSSSSSGSGSGSTEQPAVAAAPRSFLYDIGRGRTTAFNPKLRRDTYYALAQHGGEGRGPGRRLGPHRPRGAHGRNRGPDACRPRPCRRVRGVHPPPSHRSVRGCRCRLKS